MENENEQNENNQQQGDAGKDEKKFRTAFKTALAIFGDEKLLHPLTKVGHATINEIVLEITKEDTERIKVEVKEDLKKLITTYGEFEKEVKKAEQALEQTKKTKKKEFTESAQRVFRKIEGIGELQKSYAATLAGASGQGADESISDATSELIVRKADDKENSSDQTDQS